VDNFDGSCHSMLTGKVAPGENAVALPMMANAPETSVATDSASKDFMLRQ